MSTKNEDAERFGGPGSSHQDREHPGKNHQPHGHKAGGGTPGTMPQSHVPSDADADKPKDNRA